MEGSKYLDIENPLLFEEIKYWSNLKPEYHHALVFAYPLIRIADLVTKCIKCDSSTIVDFVSGLVLFAYYKKDEDGNITIPPKMFEQTNPMIDIILEWGNSDARNRAIIDITIAGDEKLHVDGLEIPITIDKLFSYWKKNPDPLLDDTDVLNLNTNYIEFRKSFFTKKDTAIVSKQTDEQVTDIYNIVISHLSHVRDRFVIESDYENFAKLLTKFFNSEEYYLPEIPFRIVDNSRLVIGHHLRAIHKRLNNAKSLRSDKDFFEIIRCLDRFKNLKEEIIYSNLVY